MSIRCSCIYKLQQALPNRVEKWPHFLFYSCRRWKQDKNSDYTIVYEHMCFEFAKLLNYYIFFTEKNRTSTTTNERLHSLAYRPLSTEQGHCCQNAQVSSGIGMKTAKFKVYHQFRKKNFFQQVKSATDDKFITKTNLCRYTFSNVIFNRKSIKHFQ